MVDNSRRRHGCPPWPAARPAAGSLRGGGERFQSTAPDQIRTMRGRHANRPGSPACHGPGLRSHRRRRSWVTG